MFMKIESLLFLTVLLIASCGGSVEQPRETASNREIAPVQDKNIGEPKKDLSKPSENAESVSKETVTKFETKNLPDGWEFIEEIGPTDKTEYDFDDGRFKLEIPEGKDLYGSNRTAPRLLKSIAGDFQIETRVKFDPKKNYQGAGLIVHGGEDDFIRFERGFGGTGGGGSGIRLDVMKAGSYSSITTTEDIATDAETVDLRILRKGNLFVAFWRLDQEDEWKEVGEFDSSYPNSIKAGLIGVSTADKITAEFAYIRLLPGAN